MIAYRVLAQNLKTKIRVERQDLSGRLVVNEDEAWQLARDFASQQEQRSGEQWAARVDTYTPR
jgi:hypothetical protein